MGITANQVSIFTGILATLYGVTIWLNDGALIWFAFLPLVLFIRMALNAIDGMLAREHDQKSKLGAYLNEICDLIADAALILPFVLLVPFEAAWIVVILLLSWMSEYIGVMGASIGASRRYDGPIGKSDRAFVFGALGLAAWVCNGLSPVLYWLQPLLAFALVITCAKRLRGALQEVREVSA